MEESNDYIAIENWTKWRIYVRQKPEDTPQVIYARTGENVSFLNQVTIHLKKIVKVCLHLFFKGCDEHGMAIGV